MQIHISVHQALMERLMMTHPRSHVMVTGGARMTSLTAEIEAGEVAVIKYLASCYRRGYEECKKWKVCSHLPVSLKYSLSHLFTIPGVLWLKFVFVLFCFFSNRFNLCLPLMSEIQGVY